ncbi:hypothetical protein EVAR_61256_1 [Eumeta japonica]|uniref:Uncharacterized protein n=1 Tax=Eumeta variegata TaxID=151549 RepID=A0A4C1Z7E3_EUMVA|nr:hypothetical protein EVAR_61256_1 [Eumeta japonica]
MTRNRASGEDPVKLSATDVASSHSIRNERLAGGRTICIENRTHTRVYTGHLRGKKRTSGHTFTRARAEYAFRGSAGAGACEPCRFLNCPTARNLLSSQTERKTVTTDLYYNFVVIISVVLWERGAPELHADCNTVILVPVRTPPAPRQNFDAALSRNTRAGVPISKSGVANDFAKAAQATPNKAHATIAVYRNVKVES